MQRQLHQRTCIAQTGAALLPRRALCRRSNSQCIGHSLAVARTLAFSTRGVRASAQQQDTEQGDLPPPGCARYSVTLRKPLGLVLEESKVNGTIIVAEVLAGGNAERLNEITPGDTLIATSGFCRTTEQVYGQTRVFGGEQVVRLNASGESFDTVMAAIGSHPGHVAVELEFQRCEQ